MNDIVKLELSTLPQNIQRSHHIFEMHTADTVFYSGEDCDPTLNDDEKGKGRQLGLLMEAAIRQTILPVTETNTPGEFTCTSSVQPANGSKHSRWISLIQFISSHFTCYGYKQSR